MAEDLKLLERKFKLRFGLKLCLLTAAGMLGLTIFLLLSLSRELSGSYGSAIYQIYSLKVKVLPLAIASFYSVLILGLAAASIGIISVLFSHKIAGPIFRIERNLERLSTGDLTVVTRFRGTDQLVNLADGLNRAVGSLNTTVQGLNGAAVEIERCERILEEALSEDGAFDEERLKEAASALSAGVEALKREASKIRT